MEEFLAQNKLDTARKTFLSHLSLKDLLNLRNIYPDFDNPFRIVDPKGQEHTFESLTRENIKKYQRILRELNQQLIDASKKGLLDRVKQLLKQPDIDVNAQDREGYTALIFASSRGHLEIVRELLKQPRIDVNAQDQFGFTALLWASQGGHLEIVRELLKQPGIDINVHPEHGDSPLIFASRNNYPEIVKELLNRPEIQINAQDSYGYNALYFAKHHPEIVQLLKPYFKAR